MVFHIETEFLSYLKGQNKPQGHVEDHYQHFETYQERNCWNPILIEVEVVKTKIKHIIDITTFRALGLKISGG